MLKWLSIPPVAALFTFALPRFLGSPEDAALVDRSLWAMVMLLFLALTVLYGLFIIHGFDAGLMPLQCIVQGMLLCPLALSSGARMVEWLGVILAVGGAAALVSAYHRDQMQYVLASVHKAKEAESHIPIPFAITDDSGNILNISDDMLEAAGLSHEEADGKSIGILLTPGDETVELKGKTWKIVQKPMEGERYYFELDEKPSTPPPAPTPAVEEGGDPFFDSVTHLRSFRYAMTRLDEELYRLRRYGRPLSAILLRLAFPGEELDVATPFNAFCGLLRSNLRELDISSIPGGTDVLIVLPECPGASADAVLQRVLTLINSLCAAYSVFYDVTTLHVVLSFETAEDAPNGAGVLLDRLNDVLAQKYSLGAG
ncbi:MAG: PAS domain S-box protein [Fretibacterium sp.]|nr:PAS domain S-box protein [Fretibacterium sp.]